MNWVGSSLVMITTLLICVVIINRWDAKLPIDRRTWGLLLFLCIVAGRIVGRRDENWLCISVVCGCLLMAGLTDWYYYSVHNFIWWISGGAALLMVVGNGIIHYKDRIFFENLWSVVIFLLLQVFFFSKMYGRADYYAFCVCALSFLGLNMQIYHCLLHMLTSYFILFIIQSFRKNIEKTGNLKVPVAFLPYISAGFLIILHKYAK